MRKLIIVTACALLAACTTAQIKKAGDTLAPVLAEVAQAATDSYVNTGKVDKQKVAAAALDGIATIAQAYTSTSVKTQDVAAILASGAGTSDAESKIGRAIVSQLPVGQITQDTVNQIFTAAAQVAGK